MSNADAVTVYNLRGLRRAVYAELGWAPKESDEARERVNEAINRAYTALVLKVPFAFFTDEITVQVYPDFVAGGADEDSHLRLAEGILGLAGQKDPWCLETLGPKEDVNEKLLQALDGTLGGRKILLEHPETKRWHERTIREVSLDNDANKVWITLVEPWEEDVVVENWRIHRRGFNIPPELVEIRRVSPLIGELFRTIEIVNGEQFALHGPEQPFFVDVGEPRLAYRREYRQIKAPTFTPEVYEAVVGNAAVPLPWTGPEPQGEFQYCYTYALGRHEGWARHAGPETQQAMLGSLQSGARRAPWLESAPSPASDFALTEGSAIGVSLPNLEKALGFGWPLTPRYGRTGMFKRIYRRRVTAEATSKAEAGDIESPDRFCLIDEVPAADTEWVDDGTKVPDYTRPLFPIHGYQTLAFWPTPAQTMDVKLLVVKHPLPLTDDSDVPRIQDVAMDLLIYMATAYVAAGQGDNAKQIHYMNLVEEQVLPDLRRRFGTMRPKSQPSSRARARVRGRRGTTAIQTRTPYRK